MKIQLLISFPINIDPNNGAKQVRRLYLKKCGQNYGHLMAQKGQRHFGVRASHGHNLAIFHPILTNEYTKMTNSSRRIEWINKLSFISLLDILVFGPQS